MDYKNAYLAGIIDGEGTINLTKYTVNGVPQITIYNTDLRLLRWIENNFGGHINLGHAKPRTKKRKLGYKLRIFGDKAVNILRMVHPYLLLKKEHAELVILWKLIKGQGVQRDIKGKYRRLTDGEKKQREYIIPEVRKLNRKGVVC